MRTRVKTERPKGLGELDEMYAAQSAYEADAMKAYEHETTHDDNDYADD